MGYTKIKKLNDSFEYLNSLAYGEDFLCEYDNFCNLADSLYNNKVTSPGVVPDINTLFGYVSNVVIPVVLKLPDYVEQVSLPNKVKVVEDSRLVIQNLHRVAKLCNDRRFNDSYNDLVSSYDQLMSNFSNEDINSSFFRETGLNSSMSTILKLGKSKQITPTDSFEKLKFYNLYPRLQHFKKEVIAKGDVFNSTENNLLYNEILDGNKDDKDEMLAIVKLIHKSISDLSKNKSTIKIEGIKYPVKWESINILFDGDVIQIKQADTLIEGELFLQDIGIRPAKKKGAKTSPQSFFLSLFIKNSNNYSDSLDATKNINQQNKMTVSKALKELFNTPEDPIYIQDKKYVTRFKASLSGSLAEIDIEQYRSGGTLYDNGVYSE